MIATINFQWAVSNMIKTYYNNKKEPISILIYLHATLMYISILQAIAITVAA